MVVISSRFVLLKHSEIIRNRATGDVGRRNIMEKTSDVKGTITGFANDNCFAIVETTTGTALLDIDDTLDYRLQIGDKIEVSEAGWYIFNGQIVTILGHKYRLNGHLHTIDEG